MAIADEPGSDDRMLLAVEEARRAIDQQKSDLSSIRDRAGNLVTTAGLAATFIGGMAVAATKGDDGTQITRWTICAAAMFVLVALAALFILRPQSWDFDMDPTGVIGWIDKQDASLDDMRRALVTELWGNYGKNEARLKSLMRVYSMGIVLLVIEIAFLLIDLKGR